MFDIDDLSKYRLDLSRDALKALVANIEEFNKNENLNTARKIVDEISHLLNNGKEVKYSQKRSQAALAARKQRSKLAKDRIVNAVNILRMENKKITQSAVAKVSGCSINTVKKYRDFISGQQVIEFI